MNALVVGTHKETLLEHLPDKFLIIDDGDLIEQISFPSRRKIVEFDVAKHFLNPLGRMNYVRAREFISILDAVFPEGESTLTKKGSNFVLLNALLSGPRSLDRLIGQNSKDSAQTDAYQKIQTLLLSPVLEHVLCRATNFSLSGIVVARLNRAELGDFDCFVLANFLISQYKGQVVVPDFDFYAAPHHVSLIRQNRLLAGVSVLERLPPILRTELLLMPVKYGHHCTADDAETLARYTGLAPGTNAYVDFIQKCIE